MLREKLEPGEFVLLPMVSTSFPRYFMFITLTFFLFSETFSIYIIYSILSTLRQNTGTFSRNTYRLHRQLTMLLAAQLTIPVVLIVIPISLRWGLFLTTGNEFSLFNNVRMTMVSLFGSANCLFTIVFISPYRIHTYNCIIYPIVYPITKVLRLKSWEPRRKSITFVSGTKRVDRIMTVKTSVFMSD